MTKEEFEQAKREFADKWRRMTHSYSPDAYTREFLSDLTALISEDYVEKAKYDEAVRQRDELREALIDMVWQFAYRGTYEGRENLHTGGLSALEGAFSALGLSDPITVLDFEAVIKNTER